MRALIKIDFLWRRCCRLMSSARPSFFFRARRLRIVVGIVGVLPALAVAADAPDLAALDLEQLMKFEVVTAAKAPQAIADAPASITVVTAADIKIHGYRTLLDALLSIRGLSSTYDRYSNYLGVRGYTASGQYNSKVLLLIDGYRTNENIYSGAFFGIDAIIDIDLVERIEFVPGPGSAIYGDSAFFGVINVITKKALSLAGTTLSGETASRYANKARVTASNPALFEGVATIFSASLLRARGSYISLLDANTGAAAKVDGLDGARDAQFYGSVATKDFTVTAVHASRTKIQGLASFERVPGVSAPATDVVSYISAEWRNKLAGDTAGLVRATLGRYTYDSDANYDAGGGNRIINVDQQEGRWADVELQLTHQALSHRIVAGVDVHLDIKQEQRNFDRAPAFTYLDVSKRRKHAGIYIQDEWQARPDIAVSSGLRFDHYEGFGNVINPRLGIVYSPSTNNRIKLLYGKAFRAPNAYETDYASPALGVAQNLSLKPERIVTTELVWESYLDARTRFVAVLFNNRIKDLIETADTDLGEVRYENVGVVKVLGGQLEFERSFASGLRLRASSSWQDVRKTALVDDRRPVDSPRQIHKVNASSPLMDSNWTLGGEAQYTSARMTRSDKVAGYTVANVALTTIKPVFGVEITLSAYNVFDRRYEDPAAAGFAQDRISQDGREWRLKLSHRFK